MLVDICYWSGEGDAAKVKERMVGGESVDSRDVDQRTPLMWAADRGQTGMNPLTPSSHTLIPTL